MDSHQYRHPSRDVNTLAAMTSLPVVQPEACCTPLDTPALPEQDATRLAEAFKALGDPVRLRILNLLITASDGEICACDLVEPVGRSQPTVSHHLKVLREAGLVDAEKRGTWVYYRARPQRLADLQGVLGAHP
jgi:ArsR family transcriptional regulator, arsenate/arsenite/antimonite-responsive transcriptional repressor